MAEGAVYQNTAASRIVPDSSSNMCLTSFQLLRHVKNALIIAVFVICTMLMTLGWKTIDLKVQTVRPYSHIVTSTASGRNVQAQPAVVTKTDHSPKDDSCVNPDVTVLGRPLDICAASEVVKLVEEEDIYFSVKTAGKNNVTRMLPVLLTWFQTVKPNRVSCTCYSLYVHGTHCTTLLLTCMVWFGASLAPELAM